MLKVLKDIFIQSRCEICGQVVSRGNFLCHDCKNKLSPVRHGYCFSCGQIYVLKEEPYLCLQCRQNPPSWHRLGFYGLYAGLLRQLLLEFKLAQKLSLGRILAFLFYEAYKMHGLERPDFILPVPMHRKKLRERGFNQSLELAKIFAQKIDVPVIKRGFEKQRHTPAQSTLNRAERLVNLKGSFLISTDVIRNKKILLLDDIMTTGTTLKECTQTLLQGGAKQVQVLFLARAG